MKAQSKACHCAYTAPYICSYCTNAKKAPSKLSIMWKGVMSLINEKGRIRAERKVKRARREI